MGENDLFDFLKIFLNAEHINYYNHLFTDLINAIASDHQYISDDTDSVQSPAATSDSHLDLPEWLVCGESVILRQSNYSGIIAFIGTTEFATGLWIGVELDAPLGEFLDRS